MSGTLEKQIRASQKFLGTVRHLPSFAEARDKQADSLLKKVSRTPVPVETAAALVDLLDSAIWGPHVDTLKSAVTLVDDGTQRKNVPLQDYLALPHYLTTGLWKSLAEDSKTLALEKLCKHCRQLGLSNASELTQAMILTLVFDLDGHLLGTEQWQVTLREKSNVQKFLKQAIPPSSMPHLQCLPQKPEDCSSEHLTRAFGTDSPVPCQRPYEHLQQRAQDWPMRSTHRFAQGVSAASGSVPAPAKREDTADLFQHMGNFVAGFLHGQKPTEGVSLPGFKMTNKTPHSVAQTVPVLALEDKKDVDMTAVVVPASELQTEEKKVEANATGKDAVSATLAALRGDVKTPDGKPKKSVKKAGLKRPASSKVIKHRPAAALRRPAAATIEGETRDARRLRLIQERVPKELQVKFRGGCSKCYFRKGCTLSCWTYRGFNMKD